MTIIQDALLATIGILVIALAVVGFEAHSRGTDLALMTAARDTLSAQLGEVSAVNTTNLATIAELRSANAANSSAAEQANKRAADATAQLQIALDQLATVQADSTKRSAKIYANDEAVRVWGDVPVPPALIDELRERTAGM